MAALRQFLPRRLYSRSLLIVVLPMLLLQIALTYVFLERHWDRVTRRLADATAGEAVLLRALYDREGGNVSRAAIARWARETMEMEMRFTPKASLETPSSISDFLPHAALAQSLRRRDRTLRFHIAPSGEKAVLMRFALPDGVLAITTPLRRVYATKSQVFILWMYCLSFAFLAISVLFLRNQIRPIERLSEAARRFGRGQEVGSLRVSGAYEVREATIAFLEMRRRIQRHILQRTEFLAGVSHDMRTPLTRMRLQAEMLEGEARESLKADIAEMEKMLESYLDFAKGAAAEESPKNVDLEDFLGAIRANPSWRDRVELLPPAKVLKASIAEGTVRRCLENLLSNASSYASRAWISALRRGRRIEILVDDDGPGIDEKDRERAFRPFQRLESSREPNRPGTGLGLTIARDMARGQGGDLTLEDSPRGGLRARLWLPC